MLFNSEEFLLGFLPFVLAAYFLLRRSVRWQNAFLVGASCAFYASWDWRFLVPLLCTTSIDYWISRRIEEGHIAKVPQSLLRRYLIVSVVANLGLLGFFKYFNFLAATLGDLANLLVVPVSVPHYDIILPLAISFYTFQALSYTIDVYRGELHATRSFRDFFLAVLYFPHLVAGPIQRAASLIPQVTNPRRFVPAQVLEGLHLMMWGMFKKVVIADNLAPIVNSAFSSPSPSGATTVIGVLAFTFQIYGDFSGYTDIARGIAKVMGFEFQLNFNLPYFATNPADFWRRWHISLSSWLRDYLYKSLGGNRGGRLLTYRNLVLTMVLGGFWHGAAWNFILWGAYHGGILAVHRALQPALLTLGSVLEGLRLATLYWFLRVLAMFLMTCYGWLLFRATSLEQVAGMTLSLIRPFEGMDWDLLGKVGLYSAPLILMQIAQFRTGNLNILLDPAVPSIVRVIVYGLMTYGMLFLGGTAQSFVYFQF
jgi:alginate O-acetyltransferase complex protein AlgI